MAFASAIVDRTIWGDKRVNYGSFSQVSGDTGGVVATGLQRLEAFFMGGELVSHAFSGGAATVVTKDPVANQNGSWMAIGY